MSQTLNKRLLCCAGLVRDGAVLADVGTDHAYLPIYLLKTGKIKRAVLSDINRGPLASAEANAASAGLLSSVELRLSNGASELSGLGVTDYAICGMGGELIAEIIEHAPHLKDENIALILNPMSRPEATRRMLFDSGFLIFREEYVTDEGKHYVCILAGYTGERVKYNTEDLYFGEERFFTPPMSEAMISYMEAKRESLISVIKGKSLGGHNADAEKMLLEALEKRLNNGR